MKQILVVGSGYAGTLAALRAARSGHSVTLLGSSPWWVHRVRWHEVLAGAKPGNIYLPTYLKKRNITWIEGQVNQLDLAQAACHYQAADGQSRQKHWDTLVLAVGSTSTSTVPGGEIHAHHLRSFNDTQGITKHLIPLAKRGGRIAIIGAGLTGVEIASELAEAYPGLTVVLIASAAVGAGLSHPAQAYIRHRVGQLQIELHEHCRVTALEADCAYTTGGGEIPFDMAIWCGGFQAPPLLRVAGLAVNNQGRVKVDSYLQATETVAVVGDAAEVCVADAPIRMGCVSAMPMGCYVGDLITAQAQGREIEPFSMEFMIRCMSLGRSDALVQWTHSDDSVRDTIWTGWRARLAKASINRGVAWATQAELRGWPLYTWKRQRPVEQPQV